MDGIDCCQLSVVGCWLLVVGCFRTDVHQAPTNYPQPTTCPNTQGYRALFACHDCMLTVTSAANHTYEQSNRIQTFPHDGSGIFYLGRVASADLRLSAQPGVLSFRAASGTCGSNEDAPRNAVRLF